jgi:glycosyltransferase involved in cell wall biosynthesis
MKVLLVHQNFPAQFKHLAPALAAQGHQIAVMCMNGFEGGPGFGGVPILRTKLQRGNTPGLHPWMVDFESKFVRGEASYHSAKKLRDTGFSPDAILAHPGWGESLFLRDLWPQARLGLYLEYYYSPHGRDSDFDREFPSPGGADDASRLRMKNAFNWLHLGDMAAGLSPTHWQASTFPPAFRERISVIHDGIDTARLAPDAGATVALDGGLSFKRGDPVVTFVNRNLEPYRGYHIFMRALPEMQRRCPGAHFVLVGAEGVSYGAAPPKGKTWKQVFLDEVKGQLDLTRVHFVGQLPYAQFTQLLQVSAVHVYLTYPFVLSWSLLEAMSLGCAIVASRTTPLLEAIEDGQTGRLVDFFDGPGLAAQVQALLENPAERARLSANARAFAQANYDLRSVCLPKQLQWVQQLADSPR